jgi:hypothetical protein
MKPSILDLPYRVDEPLGIREGFGALMDLGDGSTLRSRDIGLMSLLVFGRVLVL